MTVWTLILFLASGPIVLADNLTMEVCVRNASRIEALERTPQAIYPGLRFIHCERIDR